MLRSFVVRLEMYASTAMWTRRAPLRSGAEIATEDDDTSVDREDREAMKQTPTTEREWLR
jgi:hypothetical protein